MGKFYPEFSEAFVRLLVAVRGRQVAVVGHSRPDGDCIGSQVALARVLEASGSRAVCVNSDPVPRRLEYLTPGVRFIRTDEALLLAPETAAVFVDCADHARAGERLMARFHSPAGVIDHHLSNGGFAAINIVDSASAASCEMLAGIFIDTGMPIDPATAAALLARGSSRTRGSSGTGPRRSDASCSPGSSSQGARRPPQAGYELFERESVGKLRLLENFLASLKMEFDGRVCIGTLPRVSSRRRARPRRTPRAWSTTRDAWTASRWES